MSDPITIERLAHDRFRLTMAGVPVVIHRRPGATGCPGAYGIIDHYYAAVKAAYGTAAKMEATADGGR